MPKLSIFTPCGALALSSKPSRIQTIYEAHKANLNDRPDENFAVQPGTNIEASIYARAREHARARYTLERAYNNANPRKATETLAGLEEELGVVPSPTDTLGQRRAAITARSLLPGGATYANITAALSTLLGSDFVAYRLTQPGEVVSVPAVGGDQPGNFRVPSTVIKNYRLATGVPNPGTPTTIQYAPFDATVPTPPLLNGDALVVDPAIAGITETVTVSSATPSSFVATFTKPHDPGVLATTQPYPYWTSSKRFSLVVVTRKAAENADTRRKIHELMARIARGVSTWAIVPQGDVTHTAALTVGDAVLGRVLYAGIGAVAFA